MKTRLPKKDFEELVKIEEELAAFSVQAQSIAKASGLTREEIAMRMGNAPKGRLSRLLSGAAYYVSLDTLARFAWACGYELRVELVKKEKS